MRILNAALLILAVYAVWRIHRKQREQHLTQFLFFVRYPILFGLLLFLGPIYFPALAPDLLKNLFVQGFSEIVVTTFLGALAAWSVVYTARLTWVSVPDRCVLLLDRAQYRKWKRGTPPPTPPPVALIDGPLAVASLLLITPLAWRLASGATIAWFLAAAAIAAGLAVAFLFRSLSLRLARRWAPAGGTTWLGRMARKADARNAAQLQGRPTFLLHVRRLVLLPLLAFVWLRPAVLRLHARAAAFFACSLVLYAATFFIERPAHPLGLVPPLSFLLLLLMLATWVVSHLAFQFDNTRVPGLPVLFVALVLWQGVVPSDHVYAVHAWPTNVPREKATDVLSGWWGERGTDLPLIAVAASGGGITASLWTARVLKGLEESCAGFGERVAFTSTVSGGSVGSMYYIDSFRGEGQRGSLDEVVTSAGASSLAAATWGILYAETIRLLPGELLGTRDRGLALEQPWRRRLSQANPRLSDWAPGVVAHWRPLPIFNVTDQESGKRFVIAPVELDDRVERTTDGRPEQAAVEDALFRMRRDWLGTSGGLDLAVTTAVRLSATFPFVSPPAMPQGEVPAAARFHSVDGGYFDNSGVVTALEVLEDLLEVTAAERKQRPEVTPRLALIVIRAAPAVDSYEPEGGTETGTLLNNVMGPLEALYNVRTTLQLSRVHFDVGRLRERWREHHGVELTPYQFHLSGKLPLSWHLTADERAFIEAHWPDAPNPEGERWFEALEDEDKNALREARNDNRAVQEELQKALAEG